jgi:hypothetical protein
VFVSCLCRERLQKRKENDKYKFLYEESISRGTSQISRVKELEIQHAVDNPVYEEDKSRL